MDVDVGVGEGDKEGIGKDGGRTWKPAALRSPSSLVALVLKTPHELQRSMEMETLPPAEDLATGLAALGAAACGRGGDIRDEGASSTALKMKFETKSVDLSNYLDERGQYGALDSRNLTLVAFFATPALAARIRRGCNMMGAYGRS